MSTHLDRSIAAAMLQSNSGFAGVQSETYETRIGRIERLGVHLFQVANCLVSFGDLSARFDRAENSVIALEALFCDSQAFPEEIKVVSDTRLDSAFSGHRLVVGEPFIRFYAVHPIWDSDGKVVGSLTLIDYKARRFDDEHRLLLADLAVMVERELLLITMHQSQLELIKQNRNLKRESLIDPVLGTWNKGAIIRSLRIEMDRCAKAEKPMALMVASLDQIGTIRDSHGTSASDMVLLKIVSRIRSCLRPFDALGRFGSDIFLIVLPGASHLVATAVAERIRLSVISHPDTIDGKAIELTISAGIISTDVFPNIDPEILVGLAEKALFSAKNSGNNRVVQATPNPPDIII
jgi:diguanylate cyclase (GGDEF)-like protein